jgi:hypothetical protein
MLNMLSMGPRVREDDVKKGGVFRDAVNSTVLKKTAAEAAVFD